MGSRSNERNRRVAERVRDALARAVRDEVRDPAIGFLTITEVDLAPDLRQARVFVSTLTEDDKREASLAALRRAAPFLRRVLARDAGLRFAPALDFRFDPSLEGGARIEALLRELQPTSAEDEQVDESDAE